MVDPVWYGWVRVLRCISIHWHNDEHWWTSFVHVNRPSAYQPSVIHSPSLLGDCFSWLKSWTICSTLIDSTPGVYNAWETFATDYALGDYREITHATHGRRLYDTLRELCKINDEAKLLVSWNRPIWDDLQSSSHPRKVRNCSIRGRSDWGQSNGPTWRYWTCV